MSETILDSHSYSYAVQNKWLLVIPYKQIDPKFNIDNFQLNIQSLDIPETSKNSINVDFQGQPISLPGKLRDDEKSFTVTYLLSADYYQYRILYNWFSKSLVPPKGVPPSKNGRAQDSTIPIELYFLSEFKKPIFSITYYGSWIKSLGQIETSYTNGQEIVTQTATFVYAFQEINENLNNKELNLT